ncbi:MAG: transposase [Hyphomonadaceae bacterium]|nr:transposase [Hyphomonadaceae bacterium]
MMFRILILQVLNDLSDERAEFLITDRLSYGRFPGLRGKACGSEHDLDLSRASEKGGGDGRSVCSV